MSGKWWVWSKERQGKESIEWLLLLCAGGVGGRRYVEAPLQLNYPTLKGGERERALMFFFWGRHLF